MLKYWLGRRRLTSMLLYETKLHVKMHARNFQTRSAILDLETDEDRLKKYLLAYQNITVCL